MYGVIMAGGSGTRFWPLSRRSNPKQFLTFGGSKPIVVLTRDRFEPFISPEQTFVVAGASMTPRLRELLPELSRNQFIVEPTARNTAPCIGLAAVTLQARFGNCVMGVFPADHFISNVSAFHEVLKIAEQGAEEGAIVTLGIQPVRPETGYGYIEFQETDGMVHPVEDFVEKPDRKTAEKYLHDGGYLWNSGVFVFTTQTILGEIKRQLPELHKGLEKIRKNMNTSEEQKTIDQVFPELPSVSIDYGIMENAKQVVVVPGEFGWSDVGHWAALDDVRPPDSKGNIVSGEVLLIDTENSVLVCEDPNRILAAVGLRDQVVVVTEDATLAIPRDRAQDVRLVIKELKKDKKGYL